MLPSRRPLRCRWRCATELRARGVAVPRGLRQPARRSLRPARRSVRPGGRRPAPARARNVAAAACMWPRVYRRVSPAEGGVMTTAPPPLLAIDRLTKRYGNVIALNEVSFSITDGITGILGE